MGTKKQTRTPPKMNLEKKPLDMEAEKEKTKAEIKKRLKAEKEKIVTTILTQIVYHKKMTVGVGNEKEFYEQFEEGFKEVLTARGIRVNESLRREIENNDGRLIAKENLPKLEDLFKEFGVVPNQ